jgi:hypothetical protein
MTSTRVAPYRSTLAPTARHGFGRLLRAEWTKLRTVSRWWLTLAIGVLVTVTVSLLSSFGSLTDFAGHTPVIGPDGSAVQDDFAFVHQPLTGDGTITARVRDLAALNGEGSSWLKGGIMVKDSATEGAPYAAMLLTRAQGVRMQSNFTHDVAGGDAAPDAGHWLRLTREGDRLTGYESADGESWSTVGAVELAGLPAAAEAGLFVAASHEIRTEREFGAVAVGELATRARAVFDEVTLTGGTAGSWQLTTVGDPSVERGELDRSGGTFTLTGSGDIIPRPPHDDTTRLSLTGAQIGLIAFGTLGVLFITAEYRRGMIRTTLTASPRRGRVLLAKAIVLAAVTFPAALLAAVVSFVLGQPALRDGGFAPPIFPEVSLSDGPALRAVIGTAVVLTLVAVFALGVGALLRSTAAAVALVIVLVVLPGVLVSGLPLNVAHALLGATPAGGFSIQRTVPVYEHLEQACLPEDGCSPLGPWSGPGMLLAYTALALALAVWRLRRQDA